MSVNNKRRYTPQQESAISAHGGSALVSAAAGSGKTSVLTERVIRLITDEKNPVRADRLLIVTFTKAAAAEMRQRITAQLRERLRDDPHNTNLKHQLLLLPNADICTIDSFCSRIVRENFSELGIKRDLRIGTESELAIVRQDAIEETLEELYSKVAEGDETDFSALSDALSTSKSDYTLGKVIVSIYESILSHPFPLQWLRDAVEMYNSNLPFSETEWGKNALENLKYSVSYMKNVSTMILKRIEIRLNELEPEVLSILSLGGKPSKEEQKILKRKENLEGKIPPFLQFKALSEQIENASTWDEIVLAVTGFVPDVATKTKVDADISADISNCRKELSEVFKDIKVIFSKSSEECSAELKESTILARGLYRAVTLFDEKFKSAKRDKGIADFSDLEHLTLNLLFEKKGNNYVKTKQSYEISMKYDEIIVDEYQDTNMAQEMIFSAVSQNEENLFTVGDVKQSIYRFREAMPDIFLNRRERYKTVNKDNSNSRCYPPIFLSGNFRSRKGIIESVNFIFSQLMSERVGEVTYDDDEKLIACAEYPDIDEPETELHILTSKKRYIWYEDEARHIADIIKNTVGKLQVKDGNSTRPAEHRDICILMRSPQQFIDTYIKEFQRKGIPVSQGKGNNLFERNEVKLLISFLTAVDNPQKDIPLTSIMMSAVFGFTPDDMAKLRINSQKGKIYTALNKYVSSKDVNDNIFKEKCENFLNELYYYRKLSSTMPSDSFLEVFFSRSGFLSVIGAESDGEARIKNVRKILNLAREYEKNGFRGLSGFIRMLARLKETGGTLTTAPKKSDNDVKIMSIHGSKGLEFPVCILAATSAQRKTDNDTVIYHPKLGLAFKNYDRKNMLSGNTETRAIVTCEKKRESISEEMRILYVALTRAKEKLYLVNTLYAKDEKSFNKIFSEIKVKLPTTIGYDDNSENILCESFNRNLVDPYAVERCSNFSQWILLSALRHPSLHKLRIESSCEDVAVVPSESVWRYVRVDLENEKDEELPQEDILEVNINENLKEQIEKNLEFLYAQNELVKLPTKVSASQLSHESGEKKFIVKSIPRFMSERNIKGALRGTAFHEFLHYADIFSDDFNLESELFRLTSKCFLSVEQSDAIERKAIMKFLESDLFNRIKSSDRVMREYRFTVTIPAKLVNESISEENSDIPILMQGAIDCVFIENGKAVIVDYKTDNVQDICILAENYSKQLLLYKDAFEQTEGIKVSECIIYSLKLGESITVKS